LREKNVIWLVALACLTGCENPHDTVRSKVKARDPEVIYARGRTALADQGITRIRWGLTPYVSSSTVIDQYRPILELVSTRIGIPIDLVVGTGYADVEQRLLSGQIDVATMSPYAYVRAKQNDDQIRVFATHVAGGTETYGAYIVATENGPVQTLSDIRDQAFAFVDERSSSGWLFPAARMLDEGVNPVTDLKGRFYGSHAAVIQAVVSGEVMAGATYDGALAQGRGSIPGANTLRIIARTKRIPFDAYVVRSEFPPQGRDALLEAIRSVSTRDSVGREALATLMDINGFMPATDAHYKTVRTTQSEVWAALAQTGGSLPPTVPLPAQLENTP
jgi:phosphonate transport system substrate-binding protein